MHEGYYVLLGIGWMIAALLIFRFIITVADGSIKGMKNGFLLIFISYMLGFFLLLFGFL